jgi:antitoxin VapB
VLEHVGKRKVVWHRLSHPRAIGNVVVTIVSLGKALTAIFHGNIRRVFDPVFLIANHAKCIYSTYILFVLKGTVMKTAKATLLTTTRTFKSGNSIAVRIPREFNLEAGKTIAIKRRGNELILIEQEETLAGLIDVFKSYPADFFKAGRYDPPPEQAMAFDDVDATPSHKGNAKVAGNSNKISVRRKK